MSGPDEKIGGGKLGRLRRLRAGNLSVPVAHPERVRGDRVRNAMRLKELVGRFYDDARAAESHCDPDAVEPPMTRPSAVRVGLRVPPSPRGFGQVDDEEDDE